jgi:hypothetical protein
MGTPGSMESYIHQLFRGDISAYIDACRQAEQQISVCCRCI